MKNNLTLLVVTIGVAAFVSSSQGQPYNARGSFNGWADLLALNDDGDGTYSLTIDQSSTGVSNMTAGTKHVFKIAENDWSSSWPANDAPTFVDANGDITLHFAPGVVNDGWQPMADRVGYNDSGQHGWEIIGAFNAWDSSQPTNAQMTDNGSGLYSVNYTITNGPATNAFKFRKPGDWTVQFGDQGFSTGSGGNLSVVTTQAVQSVIFQLDLPNGRWLAGDPLPAPTNQVTFVCDLEVPVASGEFVPAFLELVVRGDFNGWATDTNFILNQVGSTSLFSNTVGIVAYQGTTINYKFYETQLPQEEVPLLSCGDARQLLITGTSMSAPFTYWSDRSLSDPTNQITFSVDMSVQELFGNFDPSTNTVFARGGWNGYDESFPLTNNPAAANTNVYSGVTDITAPLSACYKYKFFINNTNAPNSGWESPASTGGGDREFIISSASQELPLVFFNDASICDLTEVTNHVTFTLSMTNATGTDATIYDGSQPVYLNGDFAGWWGWGDPAPTVASNTYTMTNIIGTSNYVVTVSFPPGQNLRMEYKYSMNGADNEAGNDVNHIRYIRTSPGQTSYTLPLDHWINNNPALPREEALLGGLAASTSTPGNVLLEWIGLKCATLQSATSVAGPWSDAADAAGVGSTNVPASLDQEYFRLYRP